MIELAHFFDLAADAMCILDATGHCQRINAAFEKTLGYSGAAMQSRRLVELAHADDQSANQLVIDRLLAADHTTAHFTGRYQHRAGGWRWLEWSFSAATVADGADCDLGDPKPALYCVARDITQSRDPLNQPERLAEKEIHQLNLALEQRIVRRTEQLATAQNRYLELLKVERKAHHRAEASKAKAQLYADAVQNMQMGLQIWRLEEMDKPHSLRLLAANPAASKSIGMATADVLGRTILEVFPAIADTDIPQTYASVVRTGEKVDLGEVLYEDEPGKSVFSVKAFPLPDQCVGVAFENVTLRKQEEAVRHDQDIQLRIIFEQAAVGMARLDPDGHWIQVNQQLCDMLGYTMPELLTRTFAAVTHPNDAEIDIASDQRLISGETAQINFEKRCLTQQGEVVWTQVTASTVRDRQEKLLYFIATIQDITEQKQSHLALQSKTDDLMTANLMLTDALEALEQRNQELDQFAYVTSHDLKAPLRAIANLATWIEEDLEGSLPAENKEQFELLKSRVHRMEGLINGLLEYSRIGRTRQTAEMVDVSELLAEISDSLASLGEFTIEIASDMPVLQAKRILLSQVLSNLITNAIKHHDRPDGRVQVSARDLGSFYEFAVADDGPGIDPAYHHKIFAIFQTLKPRDDLESTGIGLSLVQKIVTAEGGKITLESAVGRGATFRFTWPKKSRT